MFISFHIHYALIYIADNFNRNITVEYHMHRIIVYKRKWHRKFLSLMYKCHGTKLLGVS